MTILELENNAALPIANVFLGMEDTHLCSELETREEQNTITGKTR